jgi:hypothetical protein
LTGDRSHQLRRGGFCAVNFVLRPRIRAARVKRLFDVPVERSGGVRITGYGDQRPWFWIAEAAATRARPARARMATRIMTARSFWTRTGVISRRYADTRRDEPRLAVTHVNDRKNEAVGWALAHQGRARKLEVVG